MPGGTEYARLRKAQVALANRKMGVHAVPLVTVARAELANAWTDLLHRLPHAAGPTVQNEDGTFPYLPGWDGPSEATE